MKNNTEFGYIPTKKSLCKYKFIPQQEELVFQEDACIYNFYQVTMFPDPDNGKYHIRKYVFDQDGNYLSITKILLSKRNYKKFFKVKKTNVYKLFPTFNLDNISDPQDSDLLLAKSNIF